MEKKLTALVLIALIGGLGGGFGLGFFIYEPRLSKLQSDAETLSELQTNYDETLTELQTSHDALKTSCDTLNETNLLLRTECESLRTELDELKKQKTWHFVAEFTLSRDDEALSPLFHIQSEKWRITWEFGEYWGLGTGWCGFIIFSEDGYVLETLDEVDLIVGHTLKGIHYAHTETGRYYIELRDIALDGIGFKIEEYY